MKSIPSLADVNEGNHFLSQLPEVYSTILKSAQLIQKSDSEVICQIEAPGIGTHSVSANNAIDAIRLLLEDLPSLLTQTQEVKESFESPIIVNQNTNKRFQSKVQQLTIGVTIPAKLIDYVDLQAQNEDTSFAEVFRRLALSGFEDLEEQIFEVSSDKLFESLNSTLIKWRSANSKQVMLRLDPKHAIRIRATAKEYQKSASQLGAMCIAHGQALQESINSTQQEIEKYKGAATRKLISKLELGPIPASLIAGVLNGTIDAPAILRDKLAQIFNTSENILNKCFTLSFNQQPIPAFKAENGKPKTLVKPSSWKEAVRTLQLSEEATRVLTDLDK